MCALFINRKERVTDADLVRGLQRHDRRSEQMFYDRLYAYFSQHFNELFFDPDSKQEIFQSALIKLWTEIENGKIKAADSGALCRLQPDGSYAAMTASLTTFMMAFAKTEFRELLRSVKEECRDDFAGVEQGSVEAFGEPDESELRIIVVDECIQELSERCIEIITLFYYKQKSLDEIMELRGDRNTSKDGLKTAKNKCMNTLRQRVRERAAGLDLAI